MHISILFSYIDLLVLILALTFYFDKKASFIKILWLVIIHGTIAAVSNELNLRGSVLVNIGAALAFFANYIFVFYQIHPYPIELIKPGVLLVATNIVFTILSVSIILLLRVPMEAVQGWPIQITANVILYGMIFVAIKLAKTKKVKSKMRIEKSPKLITIMLITAISTIIFVSVVASIITSDFSQGQIKPGIIVVYILITAMILLIGGIIFGKILWVYGSLYDIADAEENYAKQKEQLKHYRILKHGFNNHMATLYGMVNEGSWTLAQAYTKDILEKHETIQSYEE